MKIKFADAAQKYTSEDFSLTNFTQSDVFTELTSEFEFSIIEHLSAELSIYAGFPHLNYLNFDQEFDLYLDPTPGVTLFHFPTQISPIKRATFAFLLQKIGMRCDSKTVVVITEASQMLSKIDEGPRNISSRLYEEAIGKYCKQITRTGCLTLVTYSVTKLHPDIQEMKSTGIFAKMIDPNEREWLIRRYALNRYLEDPNNFLQGIDGEGLLFRHDMPHTVDHYVPYTLKPIIEQY
ncbi:MAG: hypothetical protein ACXAC6_17880 [Candidatus Hodarchaeales archaeon]